MRRLALRAALGLVVATLILAPVYYASVEPVAYGLLAMALGLAGLLLCLADRLDVPGFTRDLLAAVVFVSLTGLSLLYSVALPYTLDRLLLLAALFAAYLCLIRLVGVSGARTLAFVMAGVAVLAALYGLAETLSGNEEVLGYAKQSYRGSVTGTFINRNHFASLLGLSFYLMAGLALSRVSRWVRVLAAVGVGVLGAALALTLSRGGLLATVALLPVFVVTIVGRRTTGRRRLPILVGILIPVVLAACLVALTGGGLLVDRFAETGLEAGQDISVASRLSIWRSSLRAWGARPFLGWGAGTYRAVYPTYREPEVVARVQNAHNEVLELAQERGLVGLAAAVWLALAFWSVVRRSRAPDGFQPLRAGLWAGLGVLFVHALVDFSPKMPAVALYGVAAAALLRVLTRTEEAPDVEPAGRRLGWRLLVGLVMALVVWRGLAVSQAGRHVEEAERLFGEPAWSEARESYRRALAWDPLNLKATVGVARTTANMGKFSRTSEKRKELFDQAISSFERARELDSMNAEHDVQLAWLHAFNREDGLAEQAYARALEHDPTNANHIYHYASFLLHRGHVDRGLPLMRQAIQVLPKMFGGKVHELHYLLEGDTETVLSLAPEDQPFLAYQYAAFLLGQKELEASRGIFDGAWAKADRPEHWIHPYAEELGRVGGPAEAAAFLAELPPGSQSPAVLGQRVRFLVLAEQPQAVEALLAQCERSHPAHTELFLWRINYWLSRGQQTEAAEASERFLAAGGERAIGLFQQARLSVSVGQHERAADLLEEALELQPDDAGIRGLLDETLKRLLEQARPEATPERIHQLERRIGRLKASGSGGGPSPE